MVKTRKESTTEVGPKIVRFGGVGEIRALHTKESLKTREIQIKSDLYV